MPLPEFALSISEVAIEGDPIQERFFPRHRVRRIPARQGSTEDECFGKRAAAHLDYSIDMTAVLESYEIIIGAYAWTSVPTQLIVSWVFFANKGVTAFVYGGIDNEVYELVIHAKTSSGRVFQYIAEIEIDRDAAESLPSYLPPILGTEDDEDWIFLTDVLGYPITPPLTDLGLWYCPNPLGLTAATDPNPEPDPAP